MTDPVSPNGELMAALRRVPVLADLPEADLAWLAARGHETRFATGEVLFYEGDPVSELLVLLTGELHIRRDGGELDGPAFVVRAGELTGKLPYSRMTHTGGTGRAVEPIWLWSLPITVFPEMLYRLPVLGERLVAAMSDRVRESTKLDQQREKLMSLGKLSAGLAHELNNPAAAARRAAEGLRETLDRLAEINGRLDRHGLTAAERVLLGGLEVARLGTAAGAPPAVPLSGLERSDREDALTSWLEEHGLPDAWELAPSLVEAGLDEGELEPLAAGLPGAALGDALARLATTLAARGLLGEIETSTGRISELVASVKEYSYMDQTAAKPVDLRQGLESTLVMLGHKLRAKSVEVSRDYDPGLPLIDARGSELNQIWTNLIDNATDAMPAGGRLSLHVAREGEDTVLVEVADNGPGIPPGVVGRIFDPFFTTKGVGEGTGLGLDTARRIVRQHRGEIRVDSVPGDTRFQVRLPVHQPQP